MKKYVKPEMEVTEFDVEDVIITSGPKTGEGGGGDDDDGEIS